MTFVSKATRRFIVSIIRLRFPIPAYLSGPDSSLLHDPFGKAAIFQQAGRPLVRSQLATELFHEPARQWRSRFHAVALKARFQLCSRDNGLHLLDTLVGRRSWLPLCLFPAPQRVH